MIETTRFKPAFTTLTSQARLCCAVPDGHPNGLAGTREYQELGFKVLFNQQLRSYNIEFKVKEVC